MFAKLLNWLFSDSDPVVAALKKPRSSHWPRVRAEHLRTEPFCQACGRTEYLEVHHVTPFHIAPELELDPANLLTLCDGGGRSCHYGWGHLYSSWSVFNPTVREDCAYFLAKVQAAKG